MPNLPTIMTRLLNQPLLCTPDYVQVVLSVLSDRIGIAPLVSQDVQQQYRRPATTGYVDKASGVAVLPITGGLAHRGDNVAPESGLTPYTALQNKLSEYRTDSGIRGILLDVDSPGGEVNGLAEIAETLAEIAKEKPVYAIANGLMASAAYWLCAGCTRIYGAPNAVIGSIGVITAHVDRSQEMAQRGQKVTLIHAGKHKVDGNPYEELPDGVRADIQARVDGIYSSFVKAVADRRGLDEQAVRDTEAGVFSSEIALAKGLIDGVATFGDAMRALTSRVNGPHLAGVSMNKDTKMSEKLFYGETDIANAKAEGAASAKAGVEQKVADAASKAKAEATVAVAEAMVALFPKSDRATTFAEMLRDGASVEMAQKFASRLPEAETPTDNAHKANQAAIEAIVANAAPNIGVEQAKANLSDKDRRLAELTSTARSFAAARGYASLAARG